MKQLNATICALFLISGCVVGEGDAPYVFDGSLSVEVENDAPVAADVDSAIVVLSDADGHSRTELVINAGRVGLDADLTAEVRVLETSAIEEPPAEPILVSLSADGSGDHVGYLTLDGNTPGTIRIETTVFDQTVATVIDVQPLSRHLTLEWLVPSGWGCYELELGQEQELYPSLRVEAPARMAPATVDWTVSGPAVLERPTTIVESRNRSIRAIGATDARVILPSNLSDDANSVTITATAGGVTIQEVVSAVADCQTP